MSIDTQRGHQIVVSFDGPFYVSSSESANAPDLKVALKNGSVPMTVRTVFEAIDYEGMTWISDLAVPELDLTAIEDFNKHDCLVNVGLSPKQISNTHVASCYNWFFYHGMPDEQATININKFFPDYMNTQFLFAKKAVDEIERLNNLGEKSSVLVHDVKLLGVGMAIREIAKQRGVSLHNTEIAHAFHVAFTPWPGSESTDMGRLFANMMAAYDRITFHRENDCKNFFAFVEEAGVGIHDSGESIVSANGHVTKAIADPIGICLEQFDKELDILFDNYADELIAKKQADPRVRIAFTHDRVDPIKGTAEALESIEGLLSSGYIRAEDIVIDLHLLVSGRQKLKDIDGSLLQTNIFADYDRRIHSCIDRLRAKYGEKTVEFSADFVGRDKIVERYASADLIVNASFADGFCLTIAEALHIMNRSQDVLGGQRSFVISVNAGAVEHVPGWENVNSPFVFDPNIDWSDLAIQSSFASTLLAQVQVLTQYRGLDEVSQESVFALAETDKSIIKHGGPELWHDRFAQGISPVKIQGTAVIRELAHGLETKDGLNGSGT